MRVDVLQVDHGWLFSDLARKFALYGRDEPGVEINVAAAPDPAADAHVWIRTAEAGAHPGLLSRSIVQVHDFFDEYGPGSPRRAALSEAARIGVYSPAFVDFLRARLPERAPEDFVVVPIGYDEAFTVRQEHPETFTIGFVSQHWPDGIKGEDRLVDVLRRLPFRFRLVILGMGWDGLAAELAGVGIDVTYHERYRDVEYADYPCIFRGFDVLLCTSRTEGIPTTFFEAMASGVPVVTLPVGAVADLVTPRNGRIVPDLDAAVHALQEMHAARADWFARRHDVRATVEGLTNRNFVRRHLAAAREIAQVDRR